ncbi:MAG: hypothetical protein FWF95_00890 [Syntrophorhabdaceae bacterium]|nr:hypothetical protein [Syntrophorhabdaceae bacterium]
MKKSSDRKWPVFLAAGTILCFALVIPATGSDPYDKSSQVSDGYGDFHKVFIDADAANEEETGAASEPHSYLFPQEKKSAALSWSSIAWD